MSKLHKAQTQQGHSRHFFDYIRSVGEAKSKQEEDKIVAKDLIELKKALSEKHIDKKLLKEYVVRSYYAEMLGHSAEFAHIHSVNLTSNTDLLFKRTGYLATWLSVSPEHEFMYLIVSNLQRDMKSAAFLEISCALTSASKLIRPELMTCINTDVSGLLAHPNALVRKKAVLCMHAFYRKSDGLIADQKLFRQALCDRDASVMGASLALFHDVVLNDIENQRDLLPSFISILKQITEHRLSREFDYHRVPAPWLQIKLLKLLSLLAGDNKGLSEKCTDVLTEVMKRADTGLNIGHAVVQECILTITSIYPIPELIECAAEAIAKFLGSNNSNLRYLGITALSRIVKIDRKYAQEHQQIVMTCLEDSDDTIRRKTLTLLFAMCNERNVEPIVARLIKFLAGATDVFLKQELVRNMCDMAEKYNSSAKWYVDTMNRILDLAAEYVPQTTIQGVLKLIAEGEGEDEVEDAELRTYCVETYFNLVENSDKPKPNPLYQIAAWVMGEYGFLTKKISRMMMMDRLSDMLERVRDADTKGWIVTALMKLVAHHGSFPDNVDDLVAKHKNSRSVGLQQRCYEFVELAKIPPIMKRSLPLDGCCEEIEVDETLSFLDSLVDQALQKGARPYQKKDVRLGAEEAEVALRTDAYKTQRADVVDESELQADKFNTGESDKLIIKESARRWGAKNLEEEAAIEKPAEVIPDPTETTPADPAVTTQQQQQQHADPIDLPRKPTKNEKFLNDIFGEGNGKRKGKMAKGDRAKESRRRAEEAEEATRGMTSDSAGASAPAAASAPVAVPSSSGPAARLQLNVLKQAGPEFLRLRIGVLSDVNLTSAVVTVTPPAKCSLDTFQVQHAGSIIRGYSITIPDLTAGQPIYCESNLKADDFPSGGGTAVEVEGTTAGGVKSKGSGGLALALVDVIRPVVFNTEQFGQNWGKQTGEFKVQLKFPKALTPELLQQFLLEKVGLKIIQVLGKECIAAARLVPVSQLLLCHMLIVDQVTVNMTVRSSNAGFSEAVGRFLASTLAH
jgi:AP-4 complex subunit epsilon-1